jgi:hypothetical protein
MEPASELLGNACSQNMGVEIAEQQRNLKKKEADGPDSGGASEPRENDLGDDGFDLKEKECAEKNGKTEGPFESEVRCR